MDQTGSIEVNRAEIPFHFQVPGSHILCDINVTARRIIIMYTLWLILPASI